MNNIEEDSYYDLVEKIRLGALSIADSYINGYTSLILYLRILHIQENEPEEFLAKPEVYNFQIYLCYLSMIINLSNILVNNKDSLTIHHLNSLLNSEILSQTDNYGFPELLSLSTEIIDNISNKSGFIAGLKESRDKYIAHIDKSRFYSRREPENKISIDDLKTGYKSVNPLVQKLIGVLKINPELVNYDRIESLNLWIRPSIK